MYTETTSKINLEEYFAPFRENIVGYNQPFMTPYGLKNIIYADWTASGRLYRPIEKRLLNEIGPFVGNTHTESTVTGTRMTKAYHEAHKIIKNHVNAGENDIIITQGSGMTGVVNKFQRILGLRLPEKYNSKINIPDHERPVVFVSHMEHHSNHTSWLETIADIECIMPNEEGLINLNYIEELLEKYKDRELKIASITACSNVTGIRSPYHDIAKIMHQNNGLCFVDFACSAPYVEMNMHPEDELMKLDAIYFSPHKFLGGPGSTGVLIFDASLYKNQVPDEPGGGTVAWTNPWGGKRYFDSIEQREDGGTPAFLQTMKAALAIKLKEEMGVENMLKREEQLVEIIFDRLQKIPGLHILAEKHRNRLGVVSFYIDDLHYELGTKILNDRFGIQTRAGCSCAGTYGHHLLHISQQESKKITDEIDLGDLSDKPGWMRLSVHPTLTNKEIEFTLDAIEELVNNFREWKNDYTHDPRANTFSHNNEPDRDSAEVGKWFD